MSGKIFREEQIAKGENTLQRKARKTKLEKKRKKEGRKKKKY